MFAGAGFGLLNWLPGAVRVAYTAGDPGPDPLPVGAPSRLDRDRTANALELWMQLAADDRGMSGEGTKPCKGVWAVVLVLATQTLLVSPDLMPAYSEINPFDETMYIESGRLLLAGELRELAWGDTGCVQPWVALSRLNSRPEPSFNHWFRNLPMAFYVVSGAAYGLEGFLRGLQ